jgi:histidinol phosphatase-like enzyme
VSVDINSKKAHDPEDIKKWYEMFRQALKDYGIDEEGPASVGDRMLGEVFLATVKHLNDFGEKRLFFYFRHDPRQAQI